METTPTPTPTVDLMKVTEASGGKRLPPVLSGRKELHWERPMFRRYLAADVMMTMNYKYMFQSSLGFFSCFHNSWYSLCFTLHGAKSLSSIVHKPELAAILQLDNLAS